jgi:sialate O-acetylesterase
VEDRLIPGEGDVLKGFAIAGSDKKFYWAQVQIDGSDIIVWCNTVPDPVAVRYGWATNPDGSDRLRSLLSL